MDLAAEGLWTTPPCVLPVTHPGTHVASEPALLSAPPADTRAVGPGSVIWDGLIRLWLMSEA